ncbi:hypothetical protein EJ065_3278 [Corallococcus coralloides]|uniref:Uncharacterized protein n=1 Tax=Corallococcus coralloides TaxID=184914 RepID=A0A410RSQ2_CORCK|nr:hypothetical protein EJ065_3278 [Corallococcus coralloides]
MIVSVQAGIGIGVPRRGNLDLFLNTSGLNSCVGFLIETDTHVYLAHITPPLETELERRSEIEGRRIRKSTLIAGLRPQEHLPGGSLGGGGEAYRAFRQEGVRFRDGQL